jgi:hypothetical protein
MTLPRSQPGRLSGLVLAAAVSLVGTAACFPNVRPAVSLRVVRAPKTPADASVVIDEEYIGPLGYVAARGVRLPLGEHRITIERDGYFPYDKLVVADAEPIRLDVALEPIPD